MDKNKILLTRSYDFNKEIIDKIQFLSNKNFLFLEFPMINFKELDIDFESIFNSYESKNIIITSKYASIIVSKKWKNKNTKFFVVGEESADILLEKNFSVDFFAEDVKTLNNFIQEKNLHEFCYLRGNNISFKFFSLIKEIIIYETIYTNSMPYKIEKEFSEKNISDIFLYSLNTSIYLQKILKKYFNYEMLKHLNFYCLSENIAKSIRISENIFFPQNPKTINLIEVFLNNKI